MIALLNSCNNNEIYNVDNSHKYIVQSSKSIYKDTLYISVAKGIVDKIKINAIMQINDKKKFSKSIETLFTDNKNEIRLANPTGQYFDKTILICPPYVKFPIEKGNKYTHQWTVDGKKFNQKKDIEVRSELEVIGKVDNNAELYNDKTWEINCVSKSEIGVYTSKYYFNEKYGFVYWEYVFEEYNIKVNLDSFTETIEQ